MSHGFLWLQCTVQFVFIVIVTLSVGCTHKSTEASLLQLSEADKQLLSSQYQMVNKYLQEENPTYFNVSETSLLETLPRGPFEFLLGKKEKEIQEFLAFGIGPFTRENVPDIVRLQLSDFEFDGPADAQFYFYRTNTWRFTSTMPMIECTCTDYLVLALHEGSVVSIKTKAAIPY